MFNFKQNQSILGRSVLIGGLLFYASTSFSQEVGSLGAEGSQVQTQTQEQIHAQWAEDNRLSIIQHILNGVQAEAEENGYEGWSEELSAFLNELPAEQLLKAYQADGFDNVVTAIRGGDPIDPQAYTASSQGLSSNKLLGDTLEDLVFTPLTPCRIVDTRVSGGKFGTSQTRQYSVNGNTSGQGGAVNCGVPNGADEPPAVVLNITSSGGVGNGFLTVWEVGKAKPNASLMNYQSSDIANGSIVPTGLGQLNEIQVFARTPTHVIIDVIGFLRKPEQTPLRVLRLTLSSIVAPGNSTIFSPTCPAGTTWTAGNMFPNGGTSIYSRGATRNGGTERTNCQVRNLDGVNRNAFCIAQCTNIPGH